jgi:hypothetical protein
LAFYCSFSRFYRPTHSLRTPQILTENRFDLASRLIAASDRGERGQELVAAISAVALLPEYGLFSSLTTALLTQEVEICSMSILNQVHNQIKQSNQAIKSSKSKQLMTLTHSQWYWCRGPSDIDSARWRLDSSQVSRARST